MTMTRPLSRMRLANVELQGGHACQVDIEVYRELGDTLHRELSVADAGGRLIDRGVGVVK
jgi:hypothetical protein